MADVSPPDLVQMFHERSLAWGGKHRQQAEILSVYNGHLPPKYHDYFHEDTHIHVPNIVKLGWDDMTGMSAKEFPIWVPPHTESDPQRKKAEKIEQWAYSINGAGRKCDGLSMKALMVPLSFSLVGLAEWVMIVRPSWDRKTPYFDWRSPIIHYPPVGYSPWDSAPLTNTMFAYRMSLAQLKARYPDKSAEFDRVYGKRTSVGRGSIDFGWSGARMTTGWSGGGRDEDRYLFVGEYYDKDRWIVATIEDQQVVLEESYTGDPGHPGVMPVVAGSIFNLGDPRSIYADQIGMQAAMARMFSLKLDYYEQTLYSTIFTTKLSNDEVNLGPGGVNYFDENIQGQPRVEVIAPRNAIDADQMMQFTLGLQRMLNKTPESRQGVGDADSAKALDRLMEGITSQIQDGFWPSYIEKHPKAYTIAAQMDMNLWGDTKKKASGKRNNSTFNFDYTPNDLLTGYEEDILIEPGLGLGGYQGELAIMQRLGAKLISKRTAFERLPDIRDADTELRRTEQDLVHEVIWADLTTRAANGQLAPGAMAKLSARISKGQFAAEAIAEMEEAGEFTVAPPPEMAGAPGAEGIPPELAAMAESLGAGGVPGPNGPPSLRALRGGAAVG